MAGRRASVYHALVVIFLEFFSWGLLTSPMIPALKRTFPDQTFLMNGIVMGIKGFLSFLSAPLIGSLSDSCGRRYLLLVTVCATCLPIPFLAVNSLLFFILISASGAFAVTFTVVFAYVADVTSEEERSSAYGLVSATFAASLVVSPALGAWIGQSFGENWVILLATLVAAADVAFIYACVPESLTQDSGHRKTQSPSSSSSSSPSSSCSPSGIWVSIRRVADPMILILCLAVLLSYLPEAGQYSCFFVYVRLVLGFGPEDVALFIAVLGLLSVVAQTGLLSLLMLRTSSKRVILIGLSCQAAQLFLYGVSRDQSILWIAAVLAAVSSITYPAISCYVSRHADPDKQGLVQGLITGVRGLCNGVGPALFGLTFDFFHVDLSDSATGLNLVTHSVTGVDTHAAAAAAASHSLVSNSSSAVHVLLSNSSLATTPLLIPALPLIPGPPFVLGSLMVLLAILVISLIPTSVQYKMLPSTSGAAGIKSMPGARPALVSRSASQSNGVTASGDKYFYTTVEQERDCEPMIRRKQRKDHQDDDDDDDDDEEEEDQESRPGTPNSPDSLSYPTDGFDFGSTRLRSKTTTSAAGVQLDIPLLLPVTVGPADSGQPL